MSPPSLSSVWVAESMSLPTLAGAHPRSHRGDPPDFSSSGPAVGSRHMNGANGPLLERSAELARIEAALGEARRGRGRFLVIEGPPGIGKTALLTAARAA